MNFHFYSQAFVLKVWNLIWNQHGKCGKVTPSYWVTAPKFGKSHWKKEAKNNNTYTPTRQLQGDTLARSWREATNAQQCGVWPAAG